MENQTNKNIARQIIKKANTYIYCILKKIRIIESNQDLNLKKWYLEYNDKNIMMRLSQQNLMSWHQ